MLTKEQIKEKIREYEYAHNGFSRLNSRDVNIANVKINRKKDQVICDVTLINDEDQIEEKFKGMEYKLSLLEK